MLTSASTHDVNKTRAPPLQPYNVFDADLPLREASSARAAAGAWTACATRASWPARPEALEHSERAERNEPVLRTHDRYGNRIDEVELDPSWHWAPAPGDRARDPLPAVEGPAARSARRARRADGCLEPGERGSDVPGVDDLLGGARPAGGARAGGRVGAPPDPAVVRRRCAGRHGHDREAGRLRRARQHHSGRACRRRAVRHQRPQVVLLISALRRVPHPRPGARRVVLLPCSSRATPAFGSSA